jgi:hypothetical protein
MFMAELRLMPIRAGVITVRAMVLIDHPGVPPARRAADGYGLGER